MKLNDTQIPLLDAAATEYGKLLAARVEAKAVGRRAEQAHIADQQLRWEMSAARYAIAGGSKNQLRNITSKNPKTVDEAIESGLRFVKNELPAEPVAPVAKSAPVDQRFEDTGDGTVSVTLQADEMNKFSAMLVDGTQSEARDWGFALDAEGRLQPDFTDDDETWNHPVVQVVNASPELKAEVIAFIQAQSN